jgi:hypothetical protein
MTVLAGSTSDSAGGGILFRPSADGSFGRTNLMSSWDTSFAGYGTVAEWVLPSWSRHAHWYPLHPSGAPVRPGIMYGIAIWTCLLVTLVAVPAGQTLLFPLTATTFVLSLGGHLIYGGVLGAWLALRRVQGTAVYGGPRAF